MFINHLLGKWMRKKIRARTCDNDASAILQAVQVLKAKGILPNLNAAGNAALQGLVSGDWNKGLKARSINVHDLRLTEPLQQLDLP